MTRRTFIDRTSLAAGGLALGSTSAMSQIAGERPQSSAAGLTILNPRNRVPVSLIIDDSTCLVNLAHFCIPQFAEVFPDRYHQKWKSLPREVPDAFVRKFGEWCAEKGVKGKYSLVPYPACVGWLDRDIPGWSRRELELSLKLVRDLLAPNWDFHPEMITHTWAIDTKTGRPYPGRTEHFMENWGFSVGKSVDELTDYLSYALRILKNVDIACEGVTTPGGFGNRVLPQLSQATLEACRNVFNAEIPHYFRHLFTDHRSVAPRIEYASGLDGPNPRCVVSIIGCTGDWFGGWDGLERGSVDQFITTDLKGGRLPEVIARGEPAIMVCHWPGIYFNGEEIGFNIFKEVVARLNHGYDNLIWMKLSEIARYWAARELTRIQTTDRGFRLRAPYSAREFTVSFPIARNREPRLAVADRIVPLKEVQSPLQLTQNTWTRQGERLLVCFELPRGISELHAS